MSRTASAPQAADQHAPRLDPRAPFVVDTRELGRRPGAMRELHRSVAAPAGGFALDTIGVPAGAEVTLDLRLEAVMEGVLVSGSVHAPLAGECGRCLEPVEAEAEVDLQELYVYDAEDADEDTGRLVGDLIDVEPAVRDALVLALPVTPLCDEDCPGLCPECGARLAEAGPDHGHETVDPRWAALGALSTHHTTETNQENRRGRPQAPDVAQQHPLATLPVEGVRAEPGGLQALPSAEAAARRVLGVRHLQRPSGRLRLTWR